MSQMPQYPTDKERLVRIETILENLISSTKRIEASISKHIEESIKKEELLEQRLEELMNAEGKRLTSLKYKIVEYFLFAALGGAVTYFATVFSKIAGS